ncbi:MAG: hypothetical protein K5924_06550 [Chloroflexi bacterium]|nr:hypothetical protein [Chloroflexota bacterium]
MSRSTFEIIRVPAAVLLLAIAAFVLWPRGGDASPAADAASATPSIVVGQPGGEVVPPSEEPSASEQATPIPTLTPAPTATTAPTPEPTPDPTQPPGPNGFTAEVLVCRSISGSSCNDRLERIPPNLATFTALVRFTDARAGDVINAVLSGPSGTIPGGAYTLQGGGDGYYYSTFQARGLPAGDYTMTATRNGEEVASTRLVKGGG